jgi:DNA-binding transcriptional LysR family regulator
LRPTGAQRGALGDLRAVRAVRRTLRRTGYDRSAMTSARLERWIARKFRLRHVELVAALYEARSILKAAKRLNLTQPTLTKALRDVEATLGVPLFERSNRGLAPTAYGEIFARHAKIVLAQLRHAAEELEDLRVGYSGKVTVGTLLAASASILPDAIVMLKKERPGVAISVAVGTYDILVPSLLVGDLDMVLGRLPDEGRSAALVYEEFYAEPICLVVRHGHPLLRRGRLGLRELTSAAWLLPLPETALRRQIERAFLDAAAPLPRNIIESVSILTNRVLLRKSDCIGVMPYHVARDDVQQKLLAILPVKLRSMDSPVGAILRAPGELPPAAAALLEYLRLAARSVPVPRL